MTQNALAKKMKLKEGSKAALYHAPEGYRAELEPLPDGVTLSDTLDGEYDWVQAFFKTEAEIASAIPDLKRAVKKTGIIWMTFPKGTSKIQTDLTRDKGWDSLKELNFKWVTLISVNETWSAFALRPYKEGEAQQNFR